MTGGCRDTRRSAAIAVSITVLLCAAGGCDVDNLLNQTASFGGDTAGQQSQFSYIVENKTRYRAILTLGAYNDLDQKSAPQFAQFGNDSAGNTLDAGATSDVLSFACARVFSIGTPELVDRIKDHVQAENYETDALIRGVYFTSGELETEEGALPTTGIAPPFEARLGVDFACDSHLVIRLEVDDVGSDPFRIDFEVIPPDGNTPG